MADVHFRVLEIIAILLPLTGVFLQMTRRVLDADETDFEDSHAVVVQILLLTAGLLFTLIGVLVSILLALETDSLALQAVYFILYAGFVAIGLALLVVFAGVHPELTVLSEQQDITTAAKKDEDE